MEMKRASIANDPRAKALLHVKTFVLQLINSYFGADYDQHVTVSYRRTIPAHR